MQKIAEIDLNVMIFLRMLNTLGASAALFDIGGTTQVACSCREKALVLHFHLVDQRARRRFWKYCDENYNYILFYSDFLDTFFGTSKGKQRRQRI